MPIRLPKSTSLLLSAEICCICSLLNFLLLAHQRQGLPQFSPFGRWLIIGHFSESLSRRHFSASPLPVVDAKISRFFQSPRMDMASKKIDRLSFDATLEELETIVHQLEQGSLPLEEALKQFEQGIHLVRAGQQKLEQAEQKIQILLTQADGSEQAVPFQPEQGEE
ncbi:exodeoxyribonuclease VII small subunit [Aeromonas hydrophila]|nr:exodeoxyribonuclease VII small subunit [Aeromonas hydrophila]QJT15417.1 exodeoxyribonuclease VII small subunit [Aeromonas sp. 2692-1]MBQ4716057.1 exodeoxyribonuclease VII small subunit [Aeromonas hydrophila]MBW3824473.1 exodeoxyribonuclease VII small subunit [Aeromonas hydrophila]MBW5267296.1 exodeoxyribonuclease VII small subunit [Aeromonas hydrophila]